MRTASLSIPCLLLAAALLGSCQMADQASLAGDGGMDGGVELRSTSQALSTPSSCGSTTGLQANAPWPMRGGCPTHVKNAEIGPLTGSARRFFDTLTDVHSSAAIATDGNLVMGADNGVVYKINPVTGAKIQEYPAGGKLKSSPAILSDSTVLIASESGHLRAIDYGTFTHKWTFPATGALGAFTGAPAVLPDSSVAIGSANKSLYIVGANGAQKWSYLTGGAITSSPAVSPDGSIVYVGSADTYLYALDVVNKVFKWRTQLAAAVSSSPAVARGRVFISAADKAYALDASTGAILWQRSLGSGTVYSPAVSESGNVLFGVKFSLSGGSMMAVSPSDGVQLWRFDTTAGVETTAVIDQLGNSYFGDNAGNMNAVDAAGRVIFKHTLPNGALAGIRSSAVISRTGGLIFGCDDNWIYSLGTARSAVPNGGTCSVDADCEPELLCGMGNGPRFGKPAGTNACWIPSCENKVKDPTETEVDCGGPCGSCTSVCSQACTLGSQVTPPALEVLSFSKGAFSRGSIGTYQTSANSIAVARGDQLRYEDRGDGHGRVALFEGPRTNRVVWSEAMGHTPEWWTGVAQTPTMMLTEDATVSPSGTTTADRWQAQAGGNAARAQTIVNAMPAGSLSTWLRLTNPASFNPASPVKTRTVLTDLTGGWYNEVLDWTLPAAWERRSMVTTPATKSTSVQMSHKGAWPGNATQFPALPAADFVVWGWQLEEGKFPSSYVPTQESALTRKVDRLVFTASDVPAWVRTGIWQIDVLPLFGASEIAAGEEYVFVSWEGGYIALSKDAAGGLIRIVSGTKVATTPLSWSSRSKLVVTVNAGAATLSVRNAGKEAASLAYGTMAIGTGKVGMGALLDGTKPAFARLSEVRRVAVPSILCASDPDCSYCGDGRVSGGEVCDTALDAYCGYGCTSNDSLTTPGSSDGCPQGQVLLENGGGRFGLPSDTDVCWPGGPSGVCPGACGTIASPCGLCVAPPNCAGKKCGDDSRDGAGGHCTDLCQPREPGCLLDSDCTVGFSCGIGMGPRMGKPSGTNICWPIECDDYMPGRQQCGTVSSLCGLCPTLPNECEDRTCGTDQYGNSCGTCASGLTCGALGKCIAPVLLRNPVESVALTTLLPVPTSPAGSVSGAFAVSNSGTATYSVPLAVPPGRANLEPSLSVDYDSGRGEGFLTAGWSLNGLSAITRCPMTYAQNGEARGVHLDKYDRFCLDGQQLFSIYERPDRPSDTRYGANGTEYRTELDSFVRVVSFGEPTVGNFYRGPEYFKAWTKDGRVLTFGKRKTARVWAKIADDAQYSPSEPVFAAWMLQEIEDRHGNLMTVRYEQFTRSYPSTKLPFVQRVLPLPFVYATEVRPVAIGYGAQGSHRVEIAYSKDKAKTLGWNPRTFTSGIGRSFSQPIHEVRTFVNDEKVSTYKLGTEMVEGQWKLTSLTACAYQGATETCHPPTTFEYEPVVPMTRIETADPLGGHIETSWKCYDCGALNRDRRAFRPQSYSTYFSFPANLDGDPYDDLFNLEFTGEGAWIYKENTLYHPFVDLYKRRAIRGQSRAFTAPGPWTSTPDKELADNLFTTTNVTKPRTSLVKPYLLLDDDLDGKHERLELEFAQTRPDLNGDGIKDRVLCETNILDGTGEWFHELALGPAAPGRQLEFGPQQFTATTPGCSYSVTDYDNDGADDIVVAGSEDPDLPPRVISLEGGRLVEMEVGQPDRLGWDADSLVRTLDANGDGLRDHVIAAEGRVTLYLGTGRDPVRFGTTAFSTLRLAPKPGSDEDLLFGHSFVWDHNGDGRDELFLPADKPGETNDKWAMIELFVPGSTSARRTTTEIPYVKVRITSQHDEAPNDIIYDWQKPVVLDWDGNGVADAVFRGGDKDDPIAVIWRGGSKRSGLLKKIKDGFARVTTVQYSDDPEDGTALRPNSYTRGTNCTYPQKCLPKLPHPIVVAHETTADLGMFTNPRAPSNASATARRRFEYRYEDARTDLRGRGWLGFRERSMREVAGEFPGAVIAETIYESDLTTTYGQRYIGAGRNKYIHQTSFSTLSDGTPVARTTTQDFDWKVETSDVGRPWVSLRTHITTVTENNVPLSRVDVGRTYDRYGNPLLQTSLWSDGRYAATITTYVGPRHPNWAALSARWLVGLPETVAAEAIDDTRKAQSAWDTKSLQVINTYYPNGDLWTTEKRVGAAVEQKTTLTYDGFGNVLTNTYTGRDATGDTVTTEYDQAGLYPVRKTSDTHHQKGLAWTELGFDLRTGALRWRRDPDGNWQTWTRDAFGRVGATSRSNGTANPTNTQIRYGAGTLSGARFSVSTSGSSQPNVVTEYNGLGQPIYRRLWDIDNVAATSTVNEWGYDSKGRLIAESSPHFFRDPVVGVHEYAYDDTGRMIRESHPLVAPSGTVTSATTTRAYFTKGSNGGFPWQLYPDGQFAVSETPPLAPTTTQVLGMRGEVLAAIDASGNATRFAYGALGDLKKRTFLNVETSFVTDALGRVTQMVDPISGTHDYVLDGLGLTQEYRRNGVLSSFDYDGLGRMLHADTPDGAYTWTWDGNGLDPSQAGRLVSHSVASAKIGNATTAYEYKGPGGAVTGIERFIEGERFFTKIENTPNGMPSVIHSPGTGAAESVKYTYNAFGRLTDVADGTGTSYWRLLQSDAYGNDAEVKLLGGITSRKRLEPATGRLALAETVTSAGTRVQQEEYQYGPRGLLFRKNDVIAKVDRRYYYDGHGRLDYQTVNNATQQFDYDAYGNLTLKPEVGTLYYDPAKPYRLVGTDSGSAFGYDTGGNGTQTLREGSDIAGGRQKVAYTAFDLPVSITNGRTETPAGLPQLPTAVSAYRYDAVNARTVEQVQTLVGGVLRPGPRTVYVGDVYRRVTQGDNTSEQVFRIPMPGGLGAEVTLKSTGARTVQVLHTDHLGSTVGATNAQGTGFVGRSYDSFGKPSSASAIKAGFTGHEHDSVTGLINMRGRMYDPTIGRFMTPDPLVQSPGNSQSWNRYSYVMNSPLSFTDPSGFEIDPAVSEDFGSDVEFTETSNSYSWTPVDQGTYGSDALAPPTAAGSSLAPAPAPDLPPPLQYNLEGTTAPSATNASASDEDEMRSGIGYGYMEAVTGGIFYYAGPERSNQAFEQGRDIGRGIGTWAGIIAWFKGSMALSAEQAAAPRAMHGTGPVAGTIEVSAGSSLGALRTAIKSGRFPGSSGEAKGSVEFVFDPTTNRMLIGARAPGTGSPHQNLARAIGADPNKVVGGTIGVQSNGRVLTTEMSGHYWQNWNSSVRQQFDDFLRSRIGDFDVSR